MRDGFIITEGVAYAKAVIFRNEPVTITKTLISDAQIDNEIALYTSARDRTYELFKNEAQNATSQTARDFLETAILYLIDPYIAEQIKTRIKVSHLCAETAIMQSYHDYITELLTSNDPFVLHNEFEIRNLAETLVLELHKKKIVLPNITEEIILVCNNITPAQFLTLNIDKIKGILLEDGNTNSHLAIVLRSTKIPAIFNVKNATKIITNDTMVLIDAFNNHIYLNPLDELIWSVQQKTKNSIQSGTAIDPMIAQYRKLSNGRIIKILANISSIAELNNLKHYPSSGIGLFRTEFLFMNYTREPSEEEQFFIYKQILSSLPDKYSVNFRTFDFNADKLPLYMTTQTAFNVGENTIGATNTNTIVRQLRALLRASEFGTMKIMFPMVSEYDELASLVNLYNKVKDNLIKEGVKISNVSIGIMIETPAGALMSGDLAKLVDFFSIGTNDLTQYTEACSREVATHRNDELTPAVLKLIALTVDNAKKANIEVCICGELVHNLNYLALLMALGLDVFSVAPFYLSKLLDTVHSTDINLSTDLSERIAKIKTKAEILELNKELINSRS